MSIMEDPATGVDSPTPQRPPSRSLWHRIKRRMPRVVTGVIVGLIVLGIKALGTWLYPIILAFFQ
jgi:hypothetical protein